MFNSWIVILLKIKLSVLNWGKASTGTPLHTEHLMTEEHFAILLDPDVTLRKSQESTARRDAS